MLKRTARQQLLSLLNVMGKALQREAVQIEVSVLRDKHLAIKKPITNLRPKSRSKCLKLQTHVIMKSSPIEGNKFKAIRLLFRGLRTSCCQPTRNPCISDSSMRDTTPTPSSQSPIAGPWAVLAATASLITCHHMPCTNQADPNKTCP